MKNKAALYSQQLAKGWRPFLTPLGAGLQEDAEEGRKALPGDLSKGSFLGAPEAEPEVPPRRPATPAPATTSQLRGRSWGDEGGGAGVWRD